jgi:hypothetical protein
MLSELDKRIMTRWLDITTETITILWLTMTWPVEAAWDWIFIKNFGGHNGQGSNY